MHRPPDDTAYQDMAIRALLLEARLRGLCPTPVRTHAEVRRTVADAVGITVAYTDATSVLDRYAELMSAPGRPEHQGISVQMEMCL